MARPDEEFYDLADYQDDEQFDPWSSAAHFRPAARSSTQPGAPLTTADQGDWEDSWQNSRAWYGGEDWQYPTWPSPQHSSLQHGNGWGYRSDPSAGSGRDDKAPS